MTYIKGANNIVADALSQLDIREEDFSQDAFNRELAADDDEFPDEFPLSYKEIAYRQGKDKALQKKLKNDPELCQKMLLDESKYHGASEHPGKSPRTKSTRTNATSGAE